MTQPVANQVAGETLDKIAESIVRRGLPYSIFDDEQDYQQTKAWLANEILSALRNERERAAGICEQGAMLASPAGVIPADDPEHERLQRLVDVLNSAARAIREGR